MATLQEPMEPNRATTEIEPAQQIEDACRAVIDLRQRPLLVLYYPGNYGMMEEQDIRYVYQAFRSQGLAMSEPLPLCDVLIHTYGGSPIAAYRLAEVIRDFSHQVTFLVPEYAYSAGTLLCFSGSEILLGHYAGLSPIDITVDEIELQSIDYFLEFAQDCEKRIKDVHKIDKGIPHTAVASELLCRLVDEVGALKVGEYYRARTLAGHYAQELLDRYMLNGLPNSRGRRNRIIRELLFGAPAHQFHIDYHMGADLGLIIGEMSTPESDTAKQVISILNELAGREIICQDISDEAKMPFIAFYPQTIGGITDER